MIVHPIGLESAYSLAIWAFNHRNQIFKTAAETRELIVDTLQNSGAKLHRIGSTLVFGDPDGGPRVLAFLDQISGQTKSIEAAVKSLDAKQAMMANSVASLQTMSMVTLGVSAIAPAILLAQFGYLSNRFKDLQTRIKSLADMFNEAMAAKLKTGLDLLDYGIAHSRQASIDHAHASCTEAMHYFDGLVARAIEREPIERTVTQYLTRHLAVSICAKARCEIATGSDAAAIQTIETHRSRLESATAKIFLATAGHAPERYLRPDLANDISLVFLRSLFQQASYIPAIRSHENVRPIIDASVSDANFFEFLRPNLPQRSWYTSNDKPELMAEIREATSAVEETNRVLSLKTFVEESGRKKLPAVEVLQSLEREKKSEKLKESPFIAWSMDGESTQKATA